MAVTESLDQYSLLRDGQSVHVRSVRPDDRDELLALNAAVSDRSLYLRFFGVSRWAADQFVNNDILGATAGPTLVAEVAGRIVGVAGFAPAAGAEAEIGILIADEFQHTGVGTVLLEYLASWARHQGIECFRAEVLAENGPMMRMLQDLGYPISAELVDGVEQVRMQLGPTAKLAERLGARDQLSDQASLRPLLSPRSVVLIGVGHRPESVGRRVLANLVSAQFTGTIAIVHPHEHEIDGIACVHSITELDPVPDLAVIAVPAEAVTRTVAECGRRGVPAAIVLSAGFAEFGPAGAEAQAELLRVARAHGVRLLGPNCLGVVNTAPAVHLNATFAPMPTTTGGLAIASQSGALGIGLIQAADRLGIGLAQFVSLGNKADISTNDLLLAWETEPQISTIALYLESFGNPQKFARIARRVSRTKPIVAIKSGRSVAGQRAGLTHTAAAAASEAAVDAMFDQAGVVRVEDLGGLLDACRVLTSCQRPRGPRIGIVGNSGGPEILAADAAVSAGLEVNPLSERLQDYLRRAAPALAASTNPVDLGAAVTPDHLEAATRVLLASGEIDLVLAVITPTSVAEPAALLEAVQRVAGSMAKPLTAVVTGAPDTSRPVALDRALPVFEFPEPAARALGVLWRYSRIRAELGEPVTPPVTPAPKPAADLVHQALLDGAEWLPPDQTAKLLALYGVSVAPYRLVASPDACAAAATELGFPVAIKAAGPVAHKTELGGVQLDVEDEAAARRAYAKVADLTGGAVLVQPMLTGDVEVLVGGLRDLRFGPLVAVGAGGVLTDLMDDRQILIAPVTPARVAVALKQLRMARLLTGFRGRRPVSTTALARLVHRVGQLVAELPEVAELDLNPVVCHGNSLIVTDAKIRLAEPIPAEDPTVRSLAAMPS